MRTVVQIKQRLLVIVALSLAFRLGACARTKALAPAVKSGATGVTIALIQSKVTDKTLEVQCEISNGLNRDIWICEQISEMGSDCDVYVAEGSHTLAIRRRFNLPTNIAWMMPPTARYLRLPAGEQRVEWMILPLPIRLGDLFGVHRYLGGQVYPERLRIEIGFYDCDLPERIFDRFGEWAQAWTTQYERIRDRDSVVRVPYGVLPLGTEQVLSTVADAPRLACGEHPWPPFSGMLEPPDLGAGTRVKIEFHPSMFDYFFPGMGEQSLFSDAEAEHLRLQKATLVDCPENVVAFDHYGDAAMWCWGIVRHEWAGVVCYRDDKPLTSFAVFADRKLLTTDGHLFTYVGDQEGLRGLVPQIEPNESFQRTKHNNSYDSGS